MLMQGFPPPANVQVTLANWQEAPYNRWSFSHMRELVPTQRIFRGHGPVTSLRANPLRLGEIALHRADGTTATVDEVLDETYTDAVVVAHDGRVVLERYAGETGPDTPHLLMSISSPSWAVWPATSSSVACCPPHSWSPTTCRSSVTAATGEPACATSWTCAPGWSSARTTRIWTPRCASSRRPWAGARRHIASCPVPMYAYLTTLGGAGEHGGVFDYRSCGTRRSRVGLRAGDEDQDGRPHRRACLVADGRRA